MDVFNNLWVISECLLDKERTDAFKKGIEKTVEKGDLVVDAGTGSGILAMLAAKRGAGKVYAIELASDLMELAKENIEKNRLEKIIKIVNEDITEFRLPGSQRADVVVMEMLDTGLVAEHQALAMKALRENNVIDENTELLPHRVDCALELIDYDFNFYNLEMKFVISARNFGATGRIRKKLSNKVMYKTVDFKKVSNLKVDEFVEVGVKENGRCNAILLSTKTYFPDFSIWGTSDMNMPVIVPLSERKVKKGTKINLSISYNMSEGFGNLQCYYNK